MNDPRPTPANNDQPVFELNWLTSSEINAAAARLGIPLSMLRRYRKSGALAATKGAKSRTGEAITDQFSPPRALAQVEAIAEARSQGFSDVNEILHFLWWSGYELENWEPWKEARLIEMQELAKSFEVYDDIPDGEADPDDRGREAMLLGEELARGEGDFKVGIRGSEDRSTFSRWLLEMAVRNPTFVLAGRKVALSGEIDEPTALTALMQSLAQPVESEAGKTQIGDILAQGFHIDQEQWAARAPRIPTHMIVPAILGLMGDPREAPPSISRMSLSQAVELRDALWRWWPLKARELLREPALACLVLIIGSRIATVLPQLLSAGPEDPWPVTNGVGFES